MRNALPLGRAVRACSRRSSRRRDDVIFAAFGVHTRFERWRHLAREHTRLPVHVETDSGFVAGGSPLTNGAFLGRSLDTSEASCVLGESGLTLVRAAGGAQPLYYSRGQDGTVLACSELEPLARLTASRASAASLARHHVDGPEPGGGYPCVQSRVTAVNASERVVVDGVSCTRTRVERWGLEERRGTSKEELADELWHEVRAAVRRSVGDAARIAVLVSGGLDSSGLVAALKADGREALPITLDFESTGDDRPHVRALETTFGVEITRLHPSQARGLTREVLVADAAPILHGTAPFELLFSQTAKALGADVLLTGVGGDDTLSGNFRAFAVEFQRRPLATLARVLTLTLPWPMTARQRVQHYIFEPSFGGTTLVAPIQRRRERELRASLPFGGPALREVLNDAARGLVLKERAPASATERFHQTADSPWMSEIGVRRAQIERLSGLPRRDPLMDPQLLAFCATLPVSTLQHGGWHRGLYRLALKGRVPESIRMRRDKARFEPAIATLFAAEGGLDAFSDLIEMEALGALGLVSPRAFRRWIDELRAPDALDSDRVWMAFRMLSLEAFARAFS